MNLFDIMRQAGGGAAFPTFAQAYGMQPDQFGRIVEAFVPAFSAGLKRSTADPLGIFELMRRLATGDYARFYLHPVLAPQTGVEPGQEMLAFLFGPEAVRRAVASQVAAFSGTDQSRLLSEIMPALASVMAGGLFHQALASGNPFAEGILRRLRSASQQAPRDGGAPKGPLDRHEEEVARREAAGFGMSDFARVSHEMMQSGLNAMAAGNVAWLDMFDKASRGGQATADAAEARKTRLSGADVFGELIEPGLKIGEAYQKEMEALFERFRPRSGG